MARRQPPSIELHSAELALDTLRERLGRRWWLAVVALVGGLQHGLSVWSVVVDLGPQERPPLLDSIIYEYIGWYLSVGARLYVDIWEVKPPLVYEVTALVATVTGDRMVLYHWTLVTLTLLAALGAAIAIGQLVLRLTDDPSAAAVAGLTPYTYPLFAWRGAIGFKPKFFIVLLGLGCLYAALTDRPLASGLLGAASVGFWQLAVIFPGVAAGIVYRRGSARDLGRLGIGGGLLAAGMLAPVLWWGALPEMVVETVLTPLIAGEELPIGDRVWLAVRMLGVPTAVAVFGLYGVGRAVRVAPGKYWWLGAVTVWLLVQLLFLDFDSAPDLLPLFGVLAVGVGLAVGMADRFSRPLGVLIALLVVLSAVSIWPAGVSTGYSWLPPAHPTPVDTQTMPTAPYTSSETRILFWRPLPTESCRTFYGGLQSRYLTRVGAPYGTACGAWDPAWEWIRAHWL